jgi:hypothetical protein
MEKNKNPETHNENFRTLKKGYSEKYPSLSCIKTTDYNQFFYTKFKTFCKGK